MKKPMLAMVAWTWLSLPLTAAAFQGGQDFGLSASLGGGDKRYFTGAPRWKRYDCAVCHIKAERKIWVEVTSAPADLFASGRYEPGRTYRVHVSLKGQHLTGQATAHRSTFVAEIADDRDAAAGVLAADDPRTVAAYDDGRVLAAVPIDAQQEWDFTWTAPASGVGPTTLYLGAVEGNGAGDPESARSDPLGDDVFMGALRLCEGATPCEKTPTAGPRRQEGKLQCASRPGAAPSGSTLLLLSLLVILASRLRRRLTLVLLLLLGSCAPHRQTGEEREGPRAQGPCPTGQLCVGPGGAAPPPRDARGSDGAMDGHGSHADASVRRDAARDATPPSPDGRALLDASADAACRLPDPCSMHHDCERCGPPPAGRFLCCINARCGQHGVMCP